MNRTCFRSWNMWGLVLLATSLASLVAADEPSAEQETQPQPATAAAPAGQPVAEVPVVVPVLRLRGTIGEAPVDGSFLFEMDQGTALKDVIARLAKARDDAAVKGVVLTIDDAGLGMGQVEELRQAISKLRGAGKEVWAHVDQLSMRSYILLAGASRLSVSPTGDVWLTGIYGESPYCRELLNKLGVTPDFLTSGEFKSAAETFMRDGPSPQAEAMENWLLDSLYAAELELIAGGRGVDVEKARLWIDGGPYVAGKAKELGIIDAVEHRQDFVSGLKQRFGEKAKLDFRYGRKTTPQPDFSSPFGVLNFYAELFGGAKKKKKPQKDAVAIVYVDGPIMLGDAEFDFFSSAAGVAASTPIRKALDAAAEDDTIKGVVLRVDSPGGSATASEIILEATKRLKTKKPLVVSMGNVAASGGYYVACGAETIFADSTTITGSIGVVGGKYATGDLWKKIGVNWKGYARGANAALLSSQRPFSADERQRMQAWLDEIYGVFKGHVVANRAAKLKKPIDELAGGRVFTGRQALELGLVDKLGTLEEAIGHVAAAAGASDYDVRVLPESKNFFEAIFEGGRDGSERRLSLQTWQAGGANPVLDAAFPFLKQLDPARFAAARQALSRLELIQREGAVLMMQELLVRP